MRDSVRRLVLTVVVLGCGGEPEPFEPQAAPVTAVQPTPQSLSADAAPAIVLDFGAPIDPSRFEPSALSVFGRWSGAMSGAVTLEEENTRLRFTPARAFSAGEWVTVSLARGLQSPEGSTLGGYAWNFWIRAGIGTLDLARIDQHSTRLPGEGRVQTYGAYAGDLNGDGFSDLLAPNELANDIRVFVNDGSGGYSGFAVVPIPGGSVPSTNEGADFNRDGWLDFAVGSAAGRIASVFIGQGDGGLVHRGNHETDAGVRGVCVVDLDFDGYPDIATANADGRMRGNVSLLRNAQGVGFAPAELMDAEVEQERTCAAADVDGDGVIDLLVGASGDDAIAVLLGDGDGGLQLGSVADAGGSPWMIAVGDVNGDGHVDVVSSNVPQNTMSVLLGNGEGLLGNPVIYPVGATPVAVDLGDIDGDGDLDAVTSHLAGASFTIHENVAGTFTNPRTLRTSGAGSCAILHDRDRDGDVDLSAIDEVDDLLILFLNR